MDNPYRPGAGTHPPHFVGRWDERVALRELLGAASTFGEAAHSTPIFSGQRGMGKTALLEAASGDAREAGFVTVRLDAPKGGELVGRLAGRLSRRIDELYGEIDDQAQRRRWRDLTRRLNVSIGVPGVASLGAEIEAPARQDPPRRGTTSDDLIAFVRASAQRSRNAGGAGLAIFVDELQDASRNDMVTFCDLAKELQNELMDVPVVVSAAGLPGLAGDIAAAATSTERFDYYELPPFTPAESELAVRVPARTLGVTWNDDAIRAVVDAAAGLPYPLQLFGRETWRAADPEAGDRLTHDHARQGIERGNRFLESGQFQARWANATRAERSLLAVMAEHGDGPVPVSVLAADLGRTMSSLSRVRDSLLRKGIVHAPARGLLQFSAQGFSRYVRAQVQDAHPETSQRRDNDDA